MSEYAEAIACLNQVVTRGKHLDDSLEGKSPLVQQICYGSLRHWFFYNQVIDSMLDKKLPKKHLDIQLLLLTGLYSIDHLKRPAYASANLVVDSAEKLGKPWAKALLNALLRRFGREKDSLGDAIRSSSIEASTNHPAWLVTRIQEDWPDHMYLLENNNRPAPMTLRVNLSKCTRESYMALLANNNVEARPGNLSDAAVILKTPCPVMSLPGFSDGLVSVQDEAPQLAPGFMNLEDGMKVLDTCAAPGGKTCHILESARELQVTAIDRDRKRIRLINENLTRLGLTARVVAKSLENLQADTGFDRILLDAPCSATGIIRRHPDIRLLRNPSDIDKLCKIQQTLIDKAFKLLGTEGELLYATCSILRQENDQVIADFLERNDRASLIELDHPRLSDASTSLVRSDCGLQFLTTARDHDGFYYAALRKEPE